MMEASLQPQFRQQLIPMTRDLYPRALQLTRHAEHARDLVQDTLLRALRFEASFTPGSNLGAWLRQILYSVFISGCRRKKRERALLEQVVDDIRDEQAHGNQLATSASMRELSPGLSRRLAELPEVFSRALMLVDVHEHSYQEAADTLGVPVGTVMSRLHRGRRMLRERIEP